MSIKATDHLLGRDRVDIMHEVGGFHLPDDPIGRMDEILKREHAARKATPICTGVLDYFPKALAEISRVSKAGSEQQNPGQPMHWDRSKSRDEPDALVRHLVKRGTFDTDGQRHSAKMAWRALALLEKELEGEKL